MTLSDTRLPGTPLLSTRDLCCERDGRLLVDKLNLQVESGHIYRIEGPNGSGKTTLLRVLCGLSSRYSGELFWQGKVLSTVVSQFQSELLYFGHQSGVKTALTPRENLLWHAALMGLSGAAADAAVERVLEKVGLFGYEDADCFTLSAGQQRRVGLGRLFLGTQKLWILDEPFTAIDKLGIAELEAWIVEFAAGGGAVVLTTHHDLNAAQAVHSIRLG